METATILMTTEKLKEILSNIKIFDRNFEITNVWTGEAPTDRCGWHLQVTYLEDDVLTGKPELQRSRKWLISREDDESAIVHTVFAAVMRSYDHVIQEHFTYKGKRVYSPHFNIVDRLAIASKV